MVCMEKIIRSWVGAERFTPIMIRSKQSTLINNGKCVRGVNGDNIHDPHLHVSQSCGKAAKTSIQVNLELKARGESLEKGSVYPSSEFRKY